MELHVERGGGDGPTLVLLHGLGGSGEVWAGVRDHLAEWWPGGWVIPDLPGHGASGTVPSYSFGGVAAAVAGVLEPGRPIAVLGHSLGGVVGLTLAGGWFGVPVTAVCGLGIKVSWSPGDLAKTAELAGKPARVFATREEALERAWKVAGLPRGNPAGESRLARSEGDGWRLALDPSAYAIGRPDVPGLLASARARVTFASGDVDPLSLIDHLRALVPDPIVLPGLGHSPHVEDPAAMRPLVESLLP